MRARFGAEVAAAGGHHLLLIGPPGAGKTMIASRIPTILPPLTIEQSLEVTALHSVAGTLSERSPMSRMAPIVAPHHSATRVAMVGGGAHVIRPGACSLAHHGVLFIDEAPECASGILDSLRQPLESGTITIARSIGNITYPSRFLLVLAANPCPCGKFAGRGLGCSCSSVQVRRYLGKLSGPLMDRIDMRITVEPVGRADISSLTLGESSAAIAERVQAARVIARERFAGRGFELNSAIPARALRTGRFGGKKSTYTQRCYRCLRIARRRNFLNEEKSARLELFAATEGGNSFWGSEITQQGAHQTLLRIKDGFYRSSKGEKTLAQMNPGGAPALLESIEKAGGIFIAPGDTTWPEQLDDLATPPIGLVVKGKVDSLKSRSIAIVGTRNPTPYGARIASDFAAGFVDREWSIISGGAYGIDTHAHN